MTDLETEILRQIHELSKELIALRERVAVLEATLKRPTERLLNGPAIATDCTRAENIAVAIRARGKKA